MSKVVTFARSTDYLHHRAQQNRREGRMLDALDLMRRVLEREPGNVEYQMDLAELLCEMDQCAQSNNVLLRVLSGDTPMNECHFGMCCNFLGLHDGAAAYSAMLRYLTGEPDAIVREEVQITLASLVQPQSNYSGRRERRAQVLFAKAQALLKSGATDEGARMLARSLAQDPDAQLPRALLALCLLMKRERKAAVQQMNMALATGKADVRTRSIAVQVYGHAGHFGQMRRQLDHLRKMPLDADERRMLIHALSELKQHRMVSDLISASLRQAPYDSWLLHRKAVSLINLGKSADEARRYWAQIVRLDPDDTIAQWYQSLAQSGQLDNAHMDYAYQVTAEERDHRIAQMDEMLQLEEDGIREMTQSRKTQNLIRWALLTGDPGISGRAFELIHFMQTQSAEQMLRELLLVPDIEHRFKIAALAELMERDANRPILMLAPDGRLCDALSDEPEPMELMPAPKRVLGIVARAQQQATHKSASLVESMWMDFVMQSGEHMPRIRRPQGWAAALMARRLKLADDPGAVRLIVEVFGCTERMMRYCLRRLDRVLKDGNDAGKEDTNEAD
ncbi:hypothetical protein LJC33_04335 [Eubacteriales bacterium OttesenSCG-928-N13]|nr:hypothetical protein [Eubacteriales bacterium OttesenSCG-928-N13]